MNQVKQKGSVKMGLWAAVSMAVGTMIGASIFSVFGVAAQIAKQDLPEAFMVSGLFAIIVAYSYAKLGKKYVSNAGPIAFILKGMGDSLITGALSVLMWFTYVVSIALFAKGFAGAVFLEIGYRYLRNRNFTFHKKLKQKSQINNQHE